MHYAFSELCHQLKKIAFTKAKIDFNRYQKREEQKYQQRFNFWDEFKKAFENNYMFFSNSSYDKYFEEMNLSITCTEEEINKKYRELAKTNHPDKGGSVEKMQQINEAKTKCLEYIKIKTK